MKTSISAIAIALFTAHAAQAVELTAPIIGSDGGTIGTVRAQEGAAGTVLTVEIDKDTLKVGWHGIHIHGTGDCSDIGKFKKSGGHIGKGAGAKHGLLNAAGPEFGDMPNLHIPHQHIAKAQFYLAGIFIVDRGEGPSLLDSDGAALVIHESPDDHVVQPIGGAGGRVACAELH